MERIDGMDLFEDLFVVIVTTLQEMKDNIDHKTAAATSSKAASFLSYLTTFEFVVTMLITRSVFYLTLGVTKLLQARTNDISDAKHLIDSLKTSVSGIRTNIDLNHSEWYEQALRLSAKVDVYESKPRTNQRQRNRANTQNTLRELLLYL